MRPRLLYADTRKSRRDNIGETIAMLDSSGRPNGCYIHYFLAGLIEGSAPGFFRLGCPDQRPPEGAEMRFRGRSRRN
jgi:hypothetical protein